jgi:hypothetical protein
VFNNDGGIRRLLMLSFGSLLCGLDTLYFLLGPQHRVRSGCPFNLRFVSIFESVHGIHSEIMSTCLRFFQLIC